MKVQVFVLRKDTADILGNTIKDGNDKILNFNHGNLIIWIIAEWAKERVDALGLDNFTSSQIEKLSGDNTRDEKERVMDAPRTGLVGPVWQTVSHFLLQEVSTPH